MILSIFKKSWILSMIPILLLNCFPIYDPYRTAMRLKVVLFTVELATIRSQNYIKLLGGLQLCLDKENKS